MAQRSMYQSADLEFRTSVWGGRLNARPVVAAGGAGDRRWLGRTRLIDAEGDSTSAPSSMDDQSRFLLVAAICAWAGFLGLMAFVATDEAFPRLLGAVALILGLAGAIVGLITVVRHRPWPLDHQWASLCDN